jgi:predicted acylesterase/phospholipase RssA
MPMATTKSVASNRDRFLVDFALQGGGAHGAFTWGALDRLLEAHAADLGQRSTYDLDTLLMSV